MSQKPHNWFWNSVTSRWELRGRGQGAPVAWADEIGIGGANARFSTAGSFAAANIAAFTSAAAVITSGTLTNANVPSTATLQTAVVANARITTGTITNANVGTLATIQKASVAQLVVGGQTVTSILEASGTFPGLTAVGTEGVGVATMTGVASLGVLAGDVVFGVPKGALAANIGFSHFYVPTTNVINIYVVNNSQASAGSQPAVGVDVVAMRAS